LKRASGGAKQQPRRPPLTPQSGAQPDFANNLHANFNFLLTGFCMPRSFLPRKFKDTFMQHISSNHTSSYAAGIFSWYYFAYFTGACGRELY